MSKKELLRDHAQAAETNTGYWLYPNSRPEGLTDEQVAFDLLLHIGKHRRYSGDKKGAKLLRSLPENERLKLTACACQQVRLSYQHLPAEIERITSEEIASEDDCARYESMLYDADELNVVMIMIIEIGQDVIHLAFSVTELFRAASCLESDIYEALDRNPAYTILFAQTVLYLRRQIHPSAARAGWWIDHLAFLSDHDERTDFGFNCWLGSIAEAAAKKNNK